MASAYVSDLSELTSPAANDFMLVSDTSDPLFPDKKMQLSKMVIKSGTPTASRLASWTDANTIQDAGFLVSDFVRKTGTPVGGRAVVWTDANSIQDAGIAFSALAQKSGTPVANRVASWVDANTLQDAGFVAADVSRLSAAQTYAGVKTFSSSPEVLVSGAQALMAVTSDGSVGDFQATSYRASPNGSSMLFRGARGTRAAPVVSQSGDRVAAFIAQGYSGAAAAFANAAQINFVIDGVPDSAGDTTDMPGRIEFLTSADGSATPTTVLTLGANNLATFAGGIKFADESVGVYQEKPWPTDPSFISDVAVTYTSQLGFYVRWGPVIFAWASIIVATRSGGTAGSAAVLRLPFAPRTGFAAAIGQVQWGTKLGWITAAGSGAQAFAYGHDGVLINNPEIVAPLTVRYSIVYYV